MEGKYHGEGNLTYKNKLYKFDGQFVNGKIQRGILINEKGTYQGQFKEQKMNGKGKFIWKDGGSFEGQFLNDTINGKGKLIDSDGKLVRRFHEHFTET